MGFKMSQLKVFSRKLFLSHQDLNKIVSILQAIFSNAFSWKKMFVIQISMKFAPKGPVVN